MGHEMNRPERLCLSLFFCCCLAAANLVALASPVAAVERKIISRLTVDGLAPVRLGMKISAAERALGAKLGRLSRSSDGFSNESEAGEVCWLWRRRDGRNPGITYMTEHGWIIRIDADGHARTTERTTTGRGIGPGSSDDEVQKAYGDGLELEPHPIAAGTMWAVVERSGNGGIRIEIRNGVVVAMFAARGDALDYPEGCS
jgi:hypothetical protein